MRILISGGSGFIGRAVTTEALREGHSVTILTRNTSNAPVKRNGLSFLLWDGVSQGAWVGALASHDVIINLSGESVAHGLWTSSRKKKLVDSRIISTGLLAEAMNSVKHTVHTFINGSAIGYYGDAGNTECTESSSAGSGFLATLVMEWEAAALKATPSGVRIVMPRIGVVLGKGSGSLPPLLLQHRLFLGGYIGSGRQWMSWIHLHDIAKAFLYLAIKDHMNGPVNVTAPHPVTMKQMSHTLAKVLHRPSWLPAPAFAVRTLLGEMADIVLHSQKVLPKKLIESGFEFKYPDLEGALRHLLGRPA